jgi:hypothetical protein
MRLSPCPLSLLRNAPLQSQIGKANPMSGAQMAFSDLKFDAYLKFG